MAIASTLSIINPKTILPKRNLMQVCYLNYNAPCLLLGFDEAVQLSLPQMGFHTVFYFYAGYAG